MKRIALYQQLLADRPMRGPHVFFPLFNKEYNTTKAGSHQLHYFIKTDNIDRLKKQYYSGELEAQNISIIQERHHRFKDWHETLDFILLLIRHRINILHIVGYSSTLDPLHTLKTLEFLKPIYKLKKTFSITYNGIPTAYKLKYASPYEQDIKYENLFRRIQFEGIFTWFEDVIDWAAHSGIFKKPVIVHTPISRFCDVEKFFPSPHKEKIMVWAGAFVNYKRPELLLEALRSIAQEKDHLLEGWKVIFIGSGKKEQEIAHFIEENNLSALIEIRPAIPNYYVLINTTMLHISTQSIDHFPNLVINEAMASGCAVIATNIGRAHLFVQDGYNGYLTKTDDTDGIRQALIQFLELNDDQRNTMLANSRRLCESVHTPSNFIKSIDTFWQEVIDA
jgi:glycosyltransferase involved in cell wall biosynthesis